MADNPRCLTCVCSEPHNAPEPTCPVHGFQHEPDDTTEGLRERIAAALHGTYPADWHGPPADECTTCQTHARAALAVRDEELERLRAKVESLTESRVFWRKFAAKLEAERDDRQDERDALKAAIALVRDCHPRDSSNPRGPWCPTCLTDWPCPTIAALNAPGTPTPAEAAGR